MARENRTRYALLGMLRLRPMTGYALRRTIAVNVGHFWHESYGQLYPALRRLAAEGLVGVSPARGGPGRGARIYHITAKGRAALARWVATPPAPRRVRNELLLKVFFASWVPGEVIARNLEQVEESVRSELAVLESVPGDEMASQNDAPYRDLTLDFRLLALRGTLDWLAWAKDVVRILSLESPKC